MLGNLRPPPGPSSVGMAVLDLFTERIFRKRTLTFFGSPEQASDQLTTILRGHKRNRRAQ